MDSLNIKKTRNIMSNDSTIKPKRRSRNIDGGSAWLILAAAYVGLLIYIVTTYVYGVIYVALLQKFGASATKTSLVLTIQSLTLCCGAPFAGIVINKWSCRVAIVTGGILTTIGFASSAFVPSIDWANVTAGLVVGTGHCLICAGCHCAPGFYFEKYRDTTLTLGYIVNGFGLFIATPVGLLLLEKFGLSGLFLVCASITAQSCVMGMLIEPSVIEKEIQIKRKLAQKSKRRNISGALSDIVLLLQQKDFLCYLITNIAWGYLLGTCISHIPNFITVSGGTETKIQYVMMTFAVSSVIGRVTAVSLVNCGENVSLYGYIVTFVVSAVLTSTFPLYVTVPFGIYGFAIQAGISTGLPNTFLTQASVRFVGLDKLSEGNGISYFFMGIGYGSAPFISGFVYDISKSYNYSFVLAGIVMTVGAVCGYLALRLERKNVRQRVFDVSLETEEEAETILDRNTTDK